MPVMRISTKLKTTCSLHAENSAIEVKVNSGKNLSEF